VVDYLAHDVAVMYLGRVVESGSAEEVLRHPRHPYTKALLAAVPRPDPDRPRQRALGGEIPSVIDPPAGCAFAARCPLAEPRCRQERPVLRELASGHRAACHLA
jgi:peptide/nickel transport system ATP-binding protein